MTDLETCRGVKADGSACEAPPHMIRANGYCAAHNPETPDHMQEIARKGGEATKQKYAGSAFTADELKPIVTLEDAMQRLDVVQSAVLTRRITHAEGNAASKVIDSWVKAHAAHLTQGLVTELRAELDAKAKEIESLRKQLAGTTRGLRRAS